MQRHNLGGIETEQNQQQREAAVQARAVRSGVTRIEAFLALPLDPFAFAREWLDHYTGQCVGKQGIDILSKGLQQAVLGRGYVTTRVLVPQQDLTTGTLSFALVPGLVRQVRLADPLMWNPASEFGKLFRRNDARRQEGLW